MIAMGVRMSAEELEELRNIRAHPLTTRITAGEFIEESSWRHDLPHGIGYRYGVNPDTGEFYRWT